jgi:hypothetical protein
MAVKFTDAKKWDDVWFSELTMEQKVMFMYLCDVCDIAGFYEVNERLASLRTGVEDVRGTIKSLSKSVLLNDNYIWIKKHIKHQRNLPINTKNKAHLGIIKCIIENEEKFPEIYDSLPSADVETIFNFKGDTRGIDPPTKGLASPTSIGIGNSISNTDTPQEESLIARLYKYFVGEENLTGQGITGGTRKILAEAIRVMDVEEWKIYCDARLKDEYKAAPNKFFLEDGWRRYQDKAKKKNKEKKQAESRAEEAKERASLPKEEAPAEFKEFVKDFGKRVTRETKREPTTTS